MVKTMQLPCVLLGGAPTTATVGWVGLLGMDETSANGDLYKCIRVNGGTYTWRKIGEGGGTGVAGEVTADGIVAALGYTPAKAEDVSELLEAKVDKTGIKLDKHTDGLIYLFVDGVPVGIGLDLSGGTVEPDEPAEPEEPATPFEEVNWLDTAYVVGENSQYAYNGWCPNTVAYDDTRDVIVYMQTHGASHSVGVQSRTLVTIDPYDPTVYNKIDTFPAFVSGDGVGGLVVENGTWTVYGSKKRHQSSDGGATWNTVDVVTPPARMYGVYKIDGVVYCGDDYSTTDTSHNGYYYVSYDDGINWEQKAFDFANNYTIPCSEAHFCKWNGELYAALRREGETGILAKMVDGVWTVVTEELPNVTSDSSLLPFEDCIAISSIDRPNTKLILSIWDGESLTIRKEYNFTGVTRSGDFHTPTYLHGDDWQAVFFMTNACGTWFEYNGAVNAAVFGYTSGTIANTPTYEIETTTYTWEDVLETPSHNCTITKTTDGLTITVDKKGNDAFANTTKPYPEVNPPDENGHPYVYAFNVKPCFPTRYISDSRFGDMTIDVKAVGDRLYGCVTKNDQSKNSTPTPNVKIMGIANKYVFTDIDMTGAQYCMGIFPFLDNSTVKTTGKVYRVKQDA